SFDQYSSQSGGGIGQNFWTGLELGAVAEYSWVEIIAHNGP
ncbi:12764_t:CDS:1, partial [Gigaspora margarita]